MQKLSYDDKHFLKTMAERLKSLSIEGWKISTQYILHAREAGEILREVRLRLELVRAPFTTWVENETDISTSTAYLWMDIAEYWDDVIEPWINSRGQSPDLVEVTLPKARKLIEAHRAKQNHAKRGRPPKPKVLPQKALPKSESTPQTKALPAPPKERPTLYSTLVELVEGIDSLDVKPTAETVKQIDRTIDRLMQIRERLTKGGKK